MTQATSHNKRHFSRILFNAPVHMTADGEQWQSKLVDISLKGALVKKPDNWNGDSDTAFDLNVEIDNQELLIHMQATIAHEGQELIGFNCVNIDLDSASCLKRLVELNLSNESLLERELNSLMTAEH